MVPMKFCALVGLKIVAVNNQQALVVVAIGKHNSRLDRDEGMRVWDFQYTQSSDACCRG